MANLAKLKTVFKKSCLTTASIISAWIIILIL
jgi:hypothetical protein